MSLFPVAMATIGRKQISSTHLCSLSIQTIPDKIRVKQIDYLRKIAQRCIFYLIAKDANPSKGVKMQRILDFYCH